jgi:hypothetical protein
VCVFRSGSGSVTAVRSTPHAKLISDATQASGAGAKNMEELLSPMHVLGRRQEDRRPCDRPCGECPTALIHPPGRGYCVCVRARARLCVCARAACVRVCMRAHARARVFLDDSIGCVFVSAPQRKGRPAAVFCNTE